MKFWQGFVVSLASAEVMPTASRVAVVMGSVLFAINHGAALLHQQMSRDRWIAAGLSYLLPYLVNAHCQYVSRLAKK